MWYGATLMSVRLYEAVSKNFSEFSVISGHDEPKNMGKEYKKLNKVAFAILLHNFLYFKL